MIVKNFQIDFVVSVIVPHEDRDAAVKVAQDFVRECVIITEEPAYILDSGVDDNPLGIYELDEHGDPVLD